MPKSFTSREHDARLFGVRLRELREKKGLSQQQLADLSGVHRNYISDVERGARNACLVNILRLCTALGVAPRELFRPWD